MIRLVLLILACILFVAYINGNDIDRCVERGNSIDNCFAIYNP